MDVNDTIHSVRSSMVDAAELEGQIDDGDRLFEMHVKAADSDKSVDYGNRPISDSIKEHVNGKWQPVFQDLPAELPPERSVFHTIPLKGDEPPPHKKMYRMSRDEVQECEKQVTMLLEKGFIQKSSSECGSPMIFV